MATAFTIYIVNRERNSMNMFDKNTGSAFKGKTRKCYFRKILKSIHVVRLNINLSVSNNGYPRYLRKSLVHCVVNKHID